MKNCWCFWYPSFVTNTGVALSPFFFFGWHEYRIAGTWLESCSVLLKKFAMWIQFSGWPTSHQYGKKKTQNLICAFRISHFLTSFWIKKEESSSGDRSKGNERTNRSTPSIDERWWLLYTKIYFFTYSLTFFLSRCFVASFRLFGEQKRIGTGNWELRTANFVLALPYTSHFISFHDK